MADTETEPDSEASVMVGRRRSVIYGQNRVVSADNPTKGVLMISSKHILWTKDLRVAHWTKDLMRDAETMVKVKSFNHLEV